MQRPLRPPSMVQGGPVCLWNNTNNQGIITVGSGVNQNVASWPANAGSTVQGGVIGTVGKSGGRWYCEIALTGGNVDNGYDVGLSPAVSENYGAAGLGVGYITKSFRTAGAGADTQTPRLLYIDKSINIDPTVHWPTYPPPATLMIAADLQHSLAWFGLNGTWFGYSGGADLASGNPATGVNGIPLLTTVYYPGFGIASVIQAVSKGPGGAAGTATLRSKKSQFAYTEPAGFRPWGG